MDFETICPFVCELLTDRRYTDIDIYEDSLVATKPNGGMVHVYYIALKLNINLIKHYYTILHTNNITHAILIHASSITSSIFMPREPFRRIVAL